jgi:hypothetical protein
LTLLRFHGVIGFDPHPRAALERLVGRVNDFAGAGQFEGVGVDRVIAIAAFADAKRRIVAAMLLVRLDDESVDLQHQRLIAIGIDDDRALAFLRFLERGGRTQLGVALDRLLLQPLRLSLEEVAGPGRQQEGRTAGRLGNLADGGFDGGFSDARRALMSRAFGSGSGRSRSTRSSKSSCGWKTEFGPSTQASGSSCGCCCGNSSAPAVIGGWQTAARSSTALTWLLCMVSSTDSTEA